MFLIIENDPTVTAGTLFEELYEAGASYEIVRPHLGDKLATDGDYLGIIVLGGRMGALDDEEFPFLAQQKELIRKATFDDVPVLGICLGGQLIAAALGANVNYQSLGEKGISHMSLSKQGCFDPLFENIPYNCKAFHWHNDSFELPKGAVLLASSAVCPNQAFRCGYATYGLQFHPEVDADIVAGWVDRDCKDEKGIVEEFKEHFPDSRFLGRNLFQNFIRISGK